MRDPPHPECRLSICVICTAQQNPACWYDPTEQQLLPHSYHTTVHRTFTPPLTERLSAYLHTLAHPAIHLCNTDQHPPPTSHLLRANKEMQTFSHCTHLHDLCAFNLRITSLLYVHVYIIVFIISCFIYWASAGLVQEHTHIMLLSNKTVMSQKRWKIVTNKCLRIKIIF